MKKLQLPRLLVFVMLLFLAPTSFAASGWEGTAALAIAVSAGFLGVAYAAGFGFGINELQLMAKEEFYQLIATGLLVVLLVGGNNLLDGTSAAFGGGGPGSTLQSLANTTINTILKNPTNGLETLFIKTTQYDNEIAVQSSKTLSCNIVSIGYTITGCGGYAMINTPLSMAGGILGFAIGELYSMKKLIAIAATYAMSMILPFGILLRTLKITRGAGGLLIAVAISMHIMLPMGILFNQMLVDTFLDPTANPDAASYDGGMTTDIPNCDEGSVPRAGAAAVGHGIENVLSGTGASPISDEVYKAQNTLHDLEADLRRVIFSVMVKGTLGPVLSLLMMIASIRAITSLAGAEVDVSVLGRFI